MTIDILDGDMFASGADSLVCPVNCIGAMGAGLAVPFAERYKFLCGSYRDYCDVGNLHPGEVLALGPSSRDPSNPRIYFAATKGHWRNPSKFEWITSIQRHLIRHAIAGSATWKSIAIPAIGVGHGGLPWDDVRPVLVEAAERIERAGVKVFLYGPKETRR